MLIYLSCACGCQHYLFLLYSVAAHRSISAPKQTGLHKPLPTPANPCFSWRIWGWWAGSRLDGKMNQISLLMDEKIPFWIFDKHFWQIKSMPKGTLVMNKCTLNLILPGIKLFLKARNLFIAHWLIDLVGLSFLYCSYAEADIYFRPSTDLYRIIVSFLFAGKSTAILCLLTFQGWNLGLDNH